MSRYAVICAVLGLVLAGMFDPAVRAEEPAPETQAMPVPNFTMPEDLTFDHTEFVLPEELRKLIEESEIGSSAKINTAWAIGDTEAIQYFSGQILKDDFPQDILPLPWAEFVPKIYGTQWRGAGIINGDKRWTVISIPLNYDELSFGKRLRLHYDFLAHPIGKYFFPNGKVRIFSRGGSVFFVPEEFPENSDAIIKKLTDIWTKIESHCLIGVYHDSKTDDDHSRDSLGRGVMIRGYRWEEENYTFVLIDEAEDGGPLAAARTARMTCKHPIRVGGFYDEDSAIRLSHRFFPEEAGMTRYFYNGTSSVVPPDQRKGGDEIYSLSITTGIKADEFPSDMEKVFQAGDFAFLFTKQKELTPEYGVLSAGEMDAVNRTFYDNLRPFVEQIAAKIASGGKDAPVDLCAKVEGRVLYFAVGFAPGEEDRTVDWRLMDAIGRFFNPHLADKSGTWLSIRVDDLHAVQWRGYDFATVELDAGTDIVSIWFRLVLVQGPGVLCGAVTPVFANVAYDEMIAGLQKNLEASEQIFAAGEPWTVPSILRVETDEGIVCITGIVSDSAEEKSLLVEMFYNINQTTGTLAGLAKMMTGFMPAQNE